jgi:hypothetical protein
LAAAEAAVQGMPAVMVNHGGVGEGSVPKDIRLDNFSISLGGKELINQASVTLAYGRRYGQRTLCQALDGFLLLNRLGFFQIGLFWSGLAGPRPLAALAVENMVLP